MTLHQRSGAFNRRQVLAGSTGLSLAFALGIAPDPFDGEAHANTPAKVNAYVTIATDGTITIMSPAPEMGQAINTALPLIIAEELDADWSKVRVQNAPVNTAYDNPVFKSQFVVASISTRAYWMPCRTAGAQARRILLDAVSQHWNVPRAELTTEPSRVVHAASGRSIGYGEIAAFAKAPETLPEIKPEDLKPVARFRLIGKDVPRIDVPAKASGGALYAGDVYLPDMLYGTIVRAPYRGSGPRSFNEAEVKALPGIVDAFALDHGVGLVGRSVEQLFAARLKVKADWRDAPGAKVDSARDLQEYLAHVRDPNKQGVIGRNTGDAVAAIKGAKDVITADYTTDYVYHAQLEPHACTAWVKPDAVEVWTGTQWPSKARDEAAKAANVPPEKVTLHAMQMGGGFGRNAFVEYVTDAVLLSKKAGAPVKMIQSRDDDLNSGRFRPMTAQRIEVGLDPDGKIVGWRHRIAAEPVVPYLYGKARMEAQKNVDHIVFAGADMPHYDVANHLADHILEERGVRVAAWRGIGAGYTNFAIECTIDEIAQARRMDPLAYRLSILKEPRARAVVERAAQMAEWGRKRENGRALGLAYGKLGVPQLGLSVAATVCEVSVDKATGAVRVHNVWCAADAGLPVQPENLIAQVEGSIIFSLGSALKERVSIKDGLVEQSNFHDYEILRMSDIPEIKVEIIRSGDIPLPVGELGIPGTAPAVANALLALGGKPMRALPFTPERVKAAFA